MELNIRDEGRVTAFGQVASRSPGKTKVNGIEVDMEGADGRIVILVRRQLPHPQDSTAVTPQGSVGDPAYCFFRDLYKVKGGDVPC